LPLFSPLFRRWFVADLLAFLRKKTPDQQNVTTLARNFAVDSLYFQQTAGGRLTSRLHWLRVELRRRIGYIRRATSAEDAE